MQDKHEKINGQSFSVTELKVLAAKGKESFYEYWKKRAWQDDKLYSEEEQAKYLDELWVVASAKDEPAKIEPPKDNKKPEEKK